MPRAIIITCAVTGSAPTPARNPAVPVSPKEIADSAIGSARAGAAIVHIHVRNPRTGAPSTNPELYAEVVERIRDSSVDVLLNLTTGPGARFVHDSVDPRIAAPGTTLALPAERIAHVLELAPEICSLDIATMNRPAFSMVNLPDHLREMLLAIEAKGVKPELEVFDGGHLELLRDLIEEIGPRRPHLVQFCLGVKWGMPATSDALVYLKSRLPNDSIWSAFGVGRHSLEIAKQSIAAGGHVRVGFEDNLYLQKGVLAKSNAELVTQAVQTVEKLGCEVASGAQSRQMLGIDSLTSNVPSKAADPYLAE